MILTEAARLRRSRSRSSVSRPSLSTFVKVPKPQSTSFSSVLSLAVVLFIVLNLVLSDFLSSPVALLFFSLCSIVVYSYLSKRPVSAPLVLPQPQPQTVPPQTVMPVTPVMITIESDDLQEAEPGPRETGTLKPISRYALAEKFSERKFQAKTLAYPRVHEWARELGRFVVEKIVSEVCAEAKSIDQLLHSTAAMTGIVYVAPNEISGDLQVPRELARLTEKIQRRKYLETYFQVPGVSRPVVVSIFQRWLSEGHIDPDFLDEVNGERRLDERVLFHLLLTFTGASDGLGVCRTSEGGGGYVYDGLTGSVLEVFAAAISKSSLANLDLRRLVHRWLTQSSPASLPQSTLHQLT